MFESTSHQLQQAIQSRDLPAGMNVCVLCVCVCIPIMYVCVIMNYVCVRIGALPSLTIPHIFPPDPRSWTREQVSMWLNRAATQFELSNTFPERFPMNGKGLLLMTKEMFLYRVPEGGGLLYEDIQLKLQKVMMESFEQTTGFSMLGEEEWLNLCVCVCDSCFWYCRYRCTHRICHLQPQLLPCAFVHTHTPTHPHTHTLIQTGTSSTS